MYVFVCSMNRMISISSISIVSIMNWSYLRTASTEALKRHSLWCNCVFRGARFDRQTAPKIVPLSNKHLTMIFHYTNNIIRNPISSEFRAVVFEDVVFDNNSVYVILYLDVT